MSAPHLWPSGVLFDMDGVLTANNAFHHAAWRALAAERLGLALTTEDLELKVDGGRTPEILARLLGFAPDPDEALAFHEAKEARYRDLARGHLREVPGLVAYLHALAARGIPVALVTSGDRVNVQFVLEALDLTDHFTRRVMGEDVTRGKPDPEPFQRGAALLGLEPGRCVAHEDAVNGVRSAAGAGCTVVALTTTMPGEALLAAGAALALPDFRAWLAMLEGGRP